MSPDTFVGLAPQPQRCVDCAFSTAPCPGFEPKETPDVVWDDEETPDE